MASILKQHPVLTFAFGVPILFLFFLALGRWLKRREGVRFGSSYHLFALALSVYLLSGWLDLEIAYAQHLAAAVVVLSVFVIVPLLDRFFWRGFFERQGGAVPTFVAQLTAGLLFIGVVVLVLTVEYGVSVTGLVAGSGIAALVLGLAMQDLLSNVLACFAITLGKPFRVGDWLILESRHAQVVEINWRSTRLRTTDDVYLDVPNNQITKQTLTNLSYPTRLHAMRLHVGVEYGAPPNRVREALLRATASALAVKADPPPKVFVIDFADSAVTYEVKFWMEDHALYSDIVDSIRTRIWYELQRSRIKIPFPIRTLQIERPGADRDQARTQATVLAALRREALFRCLDDAQVGRLCAQSRTFRFGTGEAIIREGEAAVSMFILLDGRARVEVGLAGSERAVAQLDSGACFGEMSLLTGEKRSATVVAATDCEVLEVEKEVMGELLRAQPSLLQHLSDLLAQRRLQNEGLRAVQTDGTGGSKRREYTQNFLCVLRAFFEL